MAKLLMITGLGSARDLASGKRGAFIILWKNLVNTGSALILFAQSLQAYKLTSLQAISGMFTFIFRHGR